MVTFQEDAREEVANYPGAAPETLQVHVQSPH